MNYLTRSNGDEYGPRMPFVVDNLEGNKTITTSETITYNGKAVAGAVSINPLTYSPIMSALGDRVASHWDLPENLVYTSNGQVVVVETAGSATAVIVDSNRDLEKAYESLTGTVKRYVLKLTDNQNNVLYGWIYGVAASSNAYTFSVQNSRLGEAAQNWVGTLANFDYTRGCKAEIFRYTSSIAFGTGTTFTEEVRPPAGEYILTWKKLLDYANDTLSNGQYFVDYMRGTLIGKRADTTASETITYNIQANAEVELVVGGSSGSSNATLGATTALAASLVVKASAGALVGFSGFNNSSSAQYIQVHNSATLPADTAVPKIVLKADAGENFFYNPGMPLAFSTGIVLSNSSTAATKTIGSADCWFQAEYL